MVRVRNAITSSRAEFTPSPKYGLTWLGVGLGVGFGLGLRLGLGLVLLDRVDRVAQQHGGAALVQRRPDVPEAGYVRGRLGRDGLDGRVGDERRELREGFVE